MGGCKRTCRNGKLARLVFAIAGASFLAMSPSCWSALPGQMRRKALIPWVKFIPETSVCECSELATPDNQMDVYEFGGIMAALVVIPLFFVVAVPWLNRKLHCTAFSQDGCGLRVRFRPKDEEAERKRLLKKRKKESKRKGKKSKKADHSEPAATDSGHENQGEVEEDGDEYASDGEAYLDEPEEYEDGSFDYGTEDSTSGANMRARIAEDKMREEARIETLENKFNMFNKQRDFILRNQEEEEEKEKRKIPTGVLDWKRGTPDKVAPSVRILATRCVPAPRHATARKRCDLIELCEWIDQSAGPLHRSMGHVLARVAVRMGSQLEQLHRWGVVVRVRAR